MAGADDPRQSLGLAGERHAEKHLKRKRYKTIARRYRTPVGELDLVMGHGATIVFIEVKTRRDCELADPQDAVGPTKQRHLTKAARWFLQAKRLDDRPCRFDVVAITLPATGPPQIEHIEDAFDAR